MFLGGFRRGVGACAGLKGAVLAASAAIAAGLVTATPAAAETIGGALTKAYLNNPNLNSQRAAVRATDESLPKVQAAKLPTVAAQAQAGLEYTKITTPFNVAAAQNAAITGSQYSSQSISGSQPRNYGLTITQTLWDGNRTNNGITQAESQIFQAREQLRVSEQQTLLSALTAYMDVMRDTAILDLNKSNVEVLTEQLRQTRDRFNVGELTRTDVAQAESSLATAQAQELTALTQLSNSIAEYRYYIGEEPRNLAPVAPLSRQLPRNVNDAVLISQSENPNIVALLNGIDAAEMAIKIQEGALLPTASVQGNVSQEWDPLSLGGGYRLLTGSVIGNLNVPIFDGGATYASIRAAKEQLGQVELQADTTRDQVRAQVVGAWGANVNSAGVIKADKAAVDAAEVALVGVREEAKVGQRTTLDVLNAQLVRRRARLRPRRPQPCPP